MGRMDAAPNRIPMRGRASESGRRGAAAESKVCVSVCLAPLYGLYNSMEARGKWHMGGLEVFWQFLLKQVFFYGPEELSLCESASASSKGVISCSFQAPIPQPTALVC